MPYHQVKVGRHCPSRPASTPSIRGVYTDFAFDVTRRVYPVSHVGHWSLPVYVLLCRLLRAARDPNPGQGSLVAPLCYSTRLGKWTGSTPSQSVLEDTIPWVQFVQVGVTFGNGMMAAVPQTALSLVSQFLPWHGFGCHAIACWPLLTRGPCVCLSRCPTVATVMTCSTVFARLSGLPPVASPPLAGCGGYPNLTVACQRRVGST